MPGPDSRGLRLSLLTTADELEAIRSDWQQLLVRSADASTFLAPAWLLSWWAAYAPPARLCALAAYSGSILVGLAPMMIVEEKQYGVTAFVLRLLGDGTFESDHQSFIVDRSDAAAIQSFLLDSVLDLGWDIAMFSNVPESSSLLPELARWCERNGLLTAKSDSPCPARDVPESFDALLASMPARFRTAIRSTRRKLTQSHAVEFGLHTQPEELDAALAALFENHESRWRAKGQGGVFQNPKRRKFYELLAHQLIEAGDLRFFFLKLDGRIVAQEFCFAHGRTVYLLQEGFDYSLANLNLGNALRSHVFEYLIDNRYERYDFLAGVSRHKQNWSDGYPNDVTFTAWRGNLKGRALYYTPRAIEFGKSLLRPLKQRLAPTSTASARRDEQS